jgi:hypothetical protein
MQIHFNPGFIPMACRIGVLSSREPPVFSTSASKIWPFALFEILGRRMESNDKLQKWAKKDSEGRSNCVD